MEKLYWKSIKIKNNIVFKIKAFFHKKRDQWEMQKDNLSFEYRILWQVTQVFFKNLFLIVLIIVLEQLLVTQELCSILPSELQNFQSGIIGLNEKIMEDIGILANALSVMVGVVGVFLGLYCANIMSMYAEKYANAPQKISRLFENDIVTNRCILAITNYLIFSVLILFMLPLQIEIGIIMLVVSGIKGLKIIVSFGFMSRRTYQFSDMYYVTDAVFRDMFKIFRQLNRGKIFINDKNFQNHYKKQAKKCVEILAIVNNYNLEKEEKISVSVESFINKNYSILYSYWNEKSKIPYDSFWYDDKVIYKRWYKANDSEITLAMQTGTSLGYFEEKNYLWLEEEIEKINDNCFKYLINKKSFIGIIRCQGVLADLAQSAVESGNIVYYVDYLHKVQRELQNTISRADLLLEEEMAIAENIVANYLAVLIEIKKYVEKHKIECVFEGLNNFKGVKWYFPNRYYNYADVRKLYDGVRVELKLEGRQITPKWYIKQIIAKHYYEEILCFYEKIDLIVNQYIPELAKYLSEQNRTGSAMIVYAKYSEISSKIKNVESVLKETMDSLLELRKEETIIWKEIPAINVGEKFDNIYKRMFVEWCKCTSTFVLEHWESYEKYPDILGACTTYLCDILAQAIINDDFDIFALNYQNLFGMLLLYQEYSRKELVQIKEIYQQNAVLAVYSNPIIEYSMISGYAYLWGEISGDNRWKELIVDDTKKNVAKGDVGNKISEILQTVHNRMPAIYNRDVLHTHWSQIIESEFRQKENLSWKIDGFYEIYDGESKLLKAVLSEKNGCNFLDCEAFEIYAIAVLNQYIPEENKYHSRFGWEDKYYEH